MASAVPAHLQARLMLHAEQTQEGKVSILPDGAEDRPQCLSYLKMNANVKDVKIDRSEDVSRWFANTNSLEDLHMCEDQECLTPKSKEHVIYEVRECPGAPRKVRPCKRKLRDSLTESFFVPPDLQVLPSHIKALFRSEKI